MNNNCRLHELLLIRGPIFPTNGIIPPPQPRPYTVTPAPPPPTTRNLGSSPPKRRYSCAKCAYSTDRRDLFTRHENIHRDEKPFRCYVCEKMFNRADHVKKHFLRIHKGINYDVKLTKRVKGRDYDVKESSSNANCVTNSQKSPSPQMNHVTLAQTNSAQLSANCFQTNPILAELLYKRAIADTIQIPKIAFNNCHNNNSKLSQLQYHLQKPIQNEKTREMIARHESNQLSSFNKDFFTACINSEATKLSQKQTFKKTVAHQQIEDELIKDDDNQCEYCGCSFADFPSLHTHRYLLHRYISENDNCLPYKCVVCGQRSVTQRAMMQHMSRHIVSKEKSEKVAIAKDLVQHMPRLSSSNRRKQSQPRKIVKSFDEIGQQQIDLDTKCIIVNDKTLFTRCNFNCKMCHKEFTTYTQLIQHQKFSKH